MATKKTPLKLSFEPFAPVIFSLVGLSLLFCILKYFSQSPSFAAYFSAPSCPGTKTAFNYQNPVEYLRFFLHIFGSQKFADTCVTFLLLLLTGTYIEQQFGSLFTFIIVLVSAIVTAVINTCFIKTPCSGLECIVWCIFLLTAFPPENRKNLSVPVLFTLSILILKDISLIIIEKDFTVISEITGGFAGSLVSLAVSSPKTRSKKTSSKSI